MSNESKKRLYEYRKQNNLCVRCGSECDNGSANCDSCKLKYRDTQKPLKESRKASGLCIRCGSKCEKGIFCNACRDKRKVKNKEKERYRRENNLCVSCGEPNNDGLYCNICEPKIKKRCNHDHRKRRAKRVENGLCESCGGPTNGETYCELCKLRRRKNIEKQITTEPTFKERRKQTVQRRRQNRLSQGICVMCGKLPARNERTICDICGEKRRGENRRCWENRIKKGLCRYCGERAITGKTCRSCDTCFLIKTAKKWLPTEDGPAILLDILHRQNSKCPYSGMPLILGENATLDHKIPRSKGGTADILNLQWVYYDQEFNVNTIKRDMSEENFLKAINTIYEHTKSRGKYG